ncbi:hypothetical protein [Nonomuraea zeae]|uniref:Uncharacterized protein n=1 Tax=Nonomuraea zeae TaxID=1642303 RepID=A0A5S4FET7_9ACTN|nr:hypothetical protein [Nonomuraea zeae]TMR17039.1 hypothetical protein ETD85_54670 [Nonomuraea zeae]
MNGANDLERRLRSALDARAGTFEASADAWQRVREREPRPSRARWLLAALPVALLAVFVPVLLNGGLGRNTANDPDELHRQIMGDRTAAGESVTVDDPAGGGRLRLWFARGSLGNPELCYLHEPAAAAPYGSCDGLVGSFLDRAGWFAGSTAKNGEPAAMDYGVARQNATSVTAVTKGGRTIAGELLRPAGAPFLLWTVTYAAQDPVSKVSFTDTDGRRTELPRSALTRGMQADRPTGAPVELPGGLMVGPYQRKDGPALIWTRHGETLGMTSLKPEHLGQQPLTIRGGENLYFGLARKDVTAVTMTAEGGATAMAAIRPDPWGLGFGLIALTRPGERDAGYRIAAYDVAGKEVWHHEQAPLTPASPDTNRRRVGDVVTVPGTEEFSYGPVRLWFVKEQSTDLMLCHSGGVGPAGNRSGGCGLASFDDPNGFSHGSADTYLPEPGASVAFGTAGLDWESIDAVLPDGSRMPAALVPVKGLPGRIWHVKHPLGTRIAAFAVKEKGKQLERVILTRHDCWDAQQQDGRGHAVARGITAVRHADGCVRFWKDGKTLPRPFEIVPGGRLSDTIAAERPLAWGQEKTDWYGYALPGTARIEVTLQDGGTATATAELAPDPWGQGVVLFTGAVPEKAGKRGIFWRGMRFTGFDAAGRELWTYRPTEP